jgi:hypothetical protein
VKSLHRPRDDDSLTHSLYCTGTYLYLYVPVPVAIFQNIDVERPFQFNRIQTKYDLNIEVDVTYPTVVTEAEEKGTCV